MSSLPRQMAVTMATGAGQLGLNFAGGIVVARVLGPAGRGEVAAVLAATQIIGWLASLGANEAVTYVTARRPADVDRMLGTAALLILVLGTVGLAAIEGLLPLLLAAQRHELLVIARIFVLSMYVTVATGIINGLVAGRQEFDALSVMRVLLPGGYVVVLLALLAAGHVTVVSVLIANVVGNLVMLAWALRHLLQRQRMGRPSMALAREVAHFGVRMQGSLVGSLGNTRLDIVVMPAVLTAAPVGLYSVVTSASASLSSLIGTLDQVVFPAAAGREPDEALVLVARTVRFALYVSALVALPLFIAAPWILSLVYGPHFRAATTALRILLPGTVLFIGSRILASGLQGVGRPTAASAAQLAALVVTALGLALFLKPYGIAAAAAVSTVAYTCIFLIQLALLARDRRFSVRQSFSLPGLVRDLGDLRRRLRDRPLRPA